MIRLLFMLARYAVLLGRMALAGVRMFHGGFWLGLGIVALTLLATLVAAAVEAWHDALDRDQSGSQQRG